VSQQLVDQDVVDRAKAALRKAVETLNASIDKVVEGINSDTEYDRDLVIHLAWLTHQVIQVLAEFKMLEQVPGPSKGRGGGSLADMFKA
jgi:hypothetical protein